MEAAGEGDEVGSSDKRRIWRVGFIRQATERETSSSGIAHAGQVDGGGRTSTADV